MKLRARDCYSSDGSEDSVLCRVSHSGLSLSLHSLSRTSVQNRLIVILDRPRSNATLPSAIPVS